eukprot:967479-Prorocentrum_minimum.AAC.1
MSLFQFYIRSITRSDCVKRSREEGSVDPGEMYRVFHAAAARFGLTLERILAVLVLEVRNKGRSRSTRSLQPCQAVPAALTSISWRMVDRKWEPIMRWHGLFASTIPEGKLLLLHSSERIVGAGTQKVALCGLVLRACWTGKL